MAGICIVTPTLPGNDIIPEFSGNPEEDVYSFLEDCYIYLPAYGYPVETLGNTILSYLKSDARSVYGQAVLTNQVDTHDWSSVEKFMIDHFYYRDPLSVIKLMDMKMKAGQRISDFTAEFKTAARKCKGIFMDKENGPVQDILKQVYIHNLNGIHRERALQTDIKRSPSFNGLVKHLYECEYADMLRSEHAKQNPAANSVGHDNGIAAVTEIMASAKSTEISESEHSDNCTVARLKKELKFIRKEVFKLKQQFHDQPQTKFQSVCSVDSAPVVQSWRQQDQICCSDRVERLEHEFSHLQESFKEQTRALEHLSNDLFHLESKTGKGWDLVRDEISGLDQIVSEQSSRLRAEVGTVLKKQSEHSNSELAKIRGELVNDNQGLKTDLADFQQEVNAKLSRTSADCRQINTKLTALNRKVEPNYDPRRVRVEGNGVDAQKRHTEQITKTSPAPVSVTMAEFDSDGQVKDYVAATAKKAPALSSHL